VKKLFRNLFLWFWLTLLGVGLVGFSLIAHLGIHRSALLRLSLHDFLLYTIAGAVFCYFITRYLARPLRQLGEAAAGIADGRLDTRLSPALTHRRDEIADMALNFNRMAERIETLVTGQRRMLGDVSHELRSPLSRLIVALSLAKQGPATELPENLDRIGLEARRLDTLIGQLLTLSRIDSGVDRVPPVTFDLANLLQEIASDADFEARARNCRVVISRADACMLRGYEELLRSAIENVVRNAVRHTAEGTPVEVSLIVSDRRAVVRIRDQGPGVAETMLHEIFLPFHRVPDGKPDGAGLGLAIAERAVHLHQGTIAAENAHNGGLIVRLDLPC